MNGERAMNTAELVDEVAAQTGMAKDGVRKVLDAVLGAVAEAAKAGQAVMLSGFGQFRVQDRAARQGRNHAIRQPGRRSRSQPRASWRLPPPNHYGTS
jgi:DNA-binding protein HU-beta